MKNSEIGEYDDRRDWSGLCDDMLGMIISHLFLDDVKSFHLVCKAWSRIPQPSVLPPIFFPVRAQSKWLICVEGFDGTRGKFFHPLYKKPYVKNIPELSGAIIRFSSNGWFLMTRGRDSIFFLNPFTNDVIFVPEFEYNCPFVSMAFTSSPTSDDCLVIGINASLYGIGALFIIGRGEKDWRIVYQNEASYYQDHSPKIELSGGSPVFLDGKFYILGVDGNLVVFYPESPDNVTWGVSEYHKPPCDSAEDNFLAECDGTLFSVFLGFMGNWVSIFKLNDTTLMWEEVDSLGEHMLFLGFRTSLSMKKAIAGTQDKIYLPFINKNCIVFYSLATGRFGTFGNGGYSSEDLYGTGEPLHYSWIQPNFDTCSHQDLNWLATPN